jgi:hypothetical protein
MLITTPLGPSTTASEAIAGIDLAGKRAVVTGGSSGIGFETALALAAALEKDERLARRGQVSWHNGQESVTADTLGDKGPLHRIQTTRRKITFA